MVAPLIAFYPGSFDSQTMPTYVLPTFIVEKAKAALANYRQYDEAYFTKFDRVATMKIKSKYGFYAVGDLVAASEPEWCDDANYGKGAYCVSCITSGGHPFSAMAKDMTFATVGAGLAVK